MKLLKHQIWAIVVSSVLAVALITGGIFILRPYLGAYNTTDETTVTGYIGNLLNADKSLNITTYNTLLDKIGGGVGAYTGVKNSQELSSSPIIFQMGTHPTSGKAIYWQVVYRTSDYITIWMTQPYTIGVYNHTTPYVSYESAMIKTTVDNIYNRLSSSSNYPIIADISATPSEMETNTGQTWQTSQTNVIYNSTYRSLNDKLKGSSLNSKFWIPSFYEIDNSGSGSGKWVGDQDNRWGLWALSNTEQGCNSTAIDGSSAAGYCWLRSGCSGSKNSALIVKDSGGSGALIVNGTGGVRPAAHLSLSKLASKAGYSVTTSVAGGASSDSETEITPAGDGGSIYAPNSTVTVKFTIKNEHYEIASITKNGSDIQSQFTQSGNTYSYTYTVTENAEFLCTIQPKKYTLTTAVAESVGGSLKITSPQSGSTTSTASYQISYGASVTLTATANTGYKFTKWQKDGVDVETSTTYTFTMGESCNVTAYFTILSYNITIQAGTGGSVSPSGTQSWQYNSKHTITATPSTHYTFKNWTNSSGTAVSTSASYTVTVGASNQTYTANFTIKQYSIKISSNDTTMGSIVIVENNLLTDKTSLNTTANALTQYTALAITNDDYIFTGWQDASGNVVTTSNRLEVTLTNNSQYTAVFASSVTETSGVCSVEVVEVDSNNQIVTDNTSLKCIGTATIMGYSTSNGLDTVHLYTMASGGYKFAYWAILDKDTLVILKDTNGNNYNNCCDIPIDMVKGKNVIACFIEKTSTIGDTTNNT